MALLRQWLLIVSVLILGGGTIFAASTREERAYSAAVTAFQTEMWSRAETAFNQFRKNYPNSTNAPMALLLEAQAKFKQGNYTNAAALLGANKFKAGTLADQYANWIGEAQFANSNFAAAAETFGALAQDFTNSPLRLPAIVNEAAALAKLERWSEVEKILTETNGVFPAAVQLDAGSELVARGQFFLAQARFEQGNYWGTAQVIEALTSQPLAPELDWQREHWNFRLDCVSNDWESALVDTTNLIQIAKLSKNPALPAESFSLHAGILEKLNRPDDAAAAYLDNLKTETPPQWQRQAILKIAEIRIAQDRLPEAAASLEHFLTQFPNAAAGDVALLTLGELHLKQFTAQPQTMEQFAAAQLRFNQFLNFFTNNPLAGKVFLDRGWANWLAGKFPESLADFEQAVQKLPRSEDLVVARFKLADAQFVQKDFYNARKNYQSVLDDFSDFPAVKKDLSARALYQILRASLEMQDEAAANATLAKILNEAADDDLAQSCALLLGESTVAPAAARAVLENFQKQFSDSPLRPQADLAVARTFEQEQNWRAAITNYSGWLANFPTNALRAQAQFSLARANFQAGEETNALAQFSHFVRQFPASELAPQAQWWIADHYFREGTNHIEAEKNYEAIFQNTSWQGSPLVYPAQLMAGRAAMNRLGFSDAISYFTKLISDSNCPPGIKVQAQFVCGAAYMEMASPDTNNPLANFQSATNIFSQIIREHPTNELGARAWGETGNCDFQLGDYVAATNAYAQVFASTNSPADISLRSAAEIGFGMSLEKMAATLTDTNQTELLTLAADNYWSVFASENVRDGETAEEFWVKKAGLQLLPLIQSLKAAPPEKFIMQVEMKFPQLLDSLEKLRATLLEKK